MTPRLAILSGGRAGTVAPLPGLVASVGRHPTCQIRLDPDHDTEVSNRHAVLQQKEGVWVLRDLGSLQGTYLNGQRISEEQPLNDGDLLRLGADGPELQFLLSDRAPMTEPSREPVVAQQAKPALSTEQLERILEEEQAGQLARDAAAAARKRGIIRIVGGAAAVVLVGALGVFLWQRQATKRAEEEARLLLVAKADSMMASVASVQVRSPAMRASLDSARRAANTLRAALVEAGPSALAGTSIMESLDSAIARERDIAESAEFDAATVTAASVPAVGLVIAQYADGRTELATGFAIRRDGTGGVMLTTRRVILDDEGAGPVRLLVLLPGMTQPLDAEVLTAHGVEDIALLRVQQRGGIPVVPGLAWRTPPVAPGRPVAIVGYAPPIELPPNNDWRGGTITPASTTATAARVSAGFITVDAWGAAAGPGSPIIDAEGLVAGLIATAPPSAGGRLYDAVPIEFALELLDQLQ